MQNISRKPGQKLTSSEYTQKEIKLAGWILGDNFSDLQSKIDNIHSNISRKGVGVLTVDVNRSIHAIVNAVGITDPHYNQSATPFEIDFLSVGDPFWYGPQQIVTIPVTSGNTVPASIPITITISGSVFAEPVITYQANSASGSTTTSGIIIQYSPTQETLTWSGGSGPLAYGSLVSFDYSNLLILQDGVEVVAAGTFSRWEPGVTSMGVTFSGLSQGGTLNFTYNPRYL